MINLCVALLKITVQKKRLGEQVLLEQDADSPTANYSYYESWAGYPVGPILELIELLYKTLCPCT